MSVKLKKRLVRETAMSFSKGRPLMVALCPGDIVEVWPKGTRKRWEASIEAVMSMAVKIFVASEKARKAEEKRALRRGK